jgi:hypothetical protein
MSLGVGAQGYRLEVAIKGLEDSIIYLAHHYGDLQLMKDTLILDHQGRGTFQGATPLPGGMYLVIFPSKDAYVEFPLDKDQDFALTTSRQDPVNGMVVSSSEEVELFFDDLRFIQEKKEQYTQLQKTYERISAGCKTNPGAVNCDSLQLLDSLFSTVSRSVEARRAAFKASHPELLYTYILNASENPHVPDSMRQDTTAGGKDAAYRYYRAHFFDAVDFTDDRILRTAIYHQKLKTFLETLVPQHPDSIIVASDYIIERSRANKELFKYTTAWILNKYAKNEHVCMDKIYVHIAEKYYMSGLADWVGKEQLATITQDALKMKPCVCGAIGADIKATDPSGVTRSLYDIKADYTILLFIDSDCGLCQKATPKVYEYWLSVKDQGVGAMCVAIDLLPEEWKKYVSEKGYTQWINVIDPEDKSRFRVNYNVSSTPIIYVLGKDKEILGKRLGAEQLPGYMEYLMKNKDKM